MLGRLHSLFLALTGGRTHPAGPPPFRPSVECLGDRVLPSAGHAAAGSHGHAAVVAQEHDPTDKKPKPHADSNSDSRPAKHADRDHDDRDRSDVVSRRSDTGERGKGSNAKADKADSHRPARSKGGDDDDRRDAKTDKADSRDSVRSKTKGGADDDRRAAKDDDNGRRDSKGDDDDRQATKRNSARSRVSDDHAEMSPSAAEFEVAIHSVTVPVDVEPTEPLIGVELLPAGSVADRTTDSPARVVDNQEDPIPVARIEQREVPVEPLAIRVADDSERFLSPPDTEAEVASGVIDDRREHPATPVRPAGEGTAYGPPRPSEASGDTRAAPSGTTEAGWPRLRATASAQDSVPIAVSSGRTEPGATVGPLTAPAPAEVEPAEPAAAAGPIARFLPFDTADLRNAVGEFLGAMEPAIPAITEGLTPLGWAGLLAAALSAGAGVLLRHGKPTARWPVVWRRGKRSEARPGPHAGPCP